MLVQRPVGAWLGLGTQTQNEALGGIQVENRPTKYRSNRITEGAPQQFPKVGVG